MPPPGSNAAIPPLLPPPLPKMTARPARTFGNADRWGTERSEMPSAGSPEGVRGDQRSNSVSAVSWRSSATPVATAPHFETEPTGGRHCLPHSFRKPTSAISLTPRVPQPPLWNQKKTPFPTIKIQVPIVPTAVQPAAFPSSIFHSPPAVRKNNVPNYQNTNPKHPGHRSARTFPSSIFHLPFSIPHPPTAKNHVLNYQNTIPQHPTSDQPTPPFHLLLVPKVTVRRARTFGSACCAEEAAPVFVLRGSPGDVTHSPPLTVLLFVRIIEICASFSRHDRLGHAIEVKSPFVPFAPFCGHSPSPDDPDSFREAQDPDPAEGLAAPPRRETEFLPRRVRSQCPTLRTRGTKHRLPTPLTRANGDHP